MNEVIEQFERRVGTLFVSPEIDSRFNRPYKWLFERF